MSFIIPSNATQRQFFTLDSKEHSPMTTFYEEHDPSVVYYSKKGNLDPAWGVLIHEKPVGTRFIIAASEYDVKAGRKRPHIPVKYKGRVTTKAVKPSVNQPDWGYAVIKKA